MSNRKNEMDRMQARRQIQAGLVLLLVCLFWAVPFMGFPVDVYLKIAKTVFIGGIVVVAGLGLYWVWIGGKKLLKNAKPVD